MLVLWIYVQLILREEPVAIQLIHLIWGIVVILMLDLLLLIAGRLRRPAGHQAWLFGTIAKEYLTNWLDDYRH